jgi:hypothetical protein
VITRDDGLAPRARDHVLIRGGYESPDKLVIMRRRGNDSGPPLGFGSRVLFDEGSIANPG